MWMELIVLCLTIAGSVCGATWILGTRISGLEARMGRMETDMHEMRADVRSINEFLRHNPAAQ